MDPRTRKLMDAFTTELERRMEPENAKELKAADLELIRKFLTDNNATIAGVQAGDFGEVARQVAEQFPFDTEGDSALPMQ